MKAAKAPKGCRQEDERSDPLLEEDTDTLARDEADEDEDEDDDEA